MQIKSWNVDVVRAIAIYLNEKYNLINVAFLRRRDSLINLNWWFIIVDDFSINLSSSMRYVICIYVF